EFSRDLAACGGVDCFPDFPKSGFDANGFFISVNLLGTDAGTACNGSGITPVGAVGAATYVIPKAPLVAGAAIPFVLRILYPEGDSCVVQPSVPRPGEDFVNAGNGTEFLLEARQPSSVANKVRVWGISNTASLNTATPSLNVSFFDLAVE